MGMRPRSVLATASIALTVSFGVARAEGVPATASDGVRSEAPAVAGTAANALRAGVFTPARPAPDFKLKGSDGSELSLARYRGKVAIVVFGFTACPTVCPTTLRTLADAHKALGDAGSDVQILYITVDPERDDVEKMRAYLAAFDPSFIGGTGTTDELAAVRKEYGIFANRESAGESYSFSHSSYTYLVDRDGLLRALMPYGQKAEDYVHDLNILLAQRAAAAPTPAPAAPSPAPPTAKDGAP